MNEIEFTRNKLRKLDREILDRVKLRQDLARAIGEQKGKLGLPTRDFNQEKVVHRRAAERAREIGLSPDLAVRLTDLMIESSLTVQEKDRVRLQGGGSGRRVLVIGGAGRMGRWMVRFLASQGFAIEVADPAGAVEGFPHRMDWRDGDLDHDLVIVASTLRATREILTEMAKSPPRGVVFDIGSLKTPLRSGLIGLRDAGAKVTSIHPMFGPDTELLSGRHVVFVDLGVPEATRTARDLFSSSMAVQVEMDLDSHDRVIAYVLGLSHALNITFLTAMSESGEGVKKLAGFSSTTFNNQLAVAAAVAEDNPHLYYEIQFLNDYGLDSLDAMVSAAERVRRAVRDGDEAGFADLMAAGRDYLEGRTKA